MKIKYLLLAALMAFGMLAMLSCSNANLVEMTVTVQINDLEGNAVREEKVVIKDSPENLTVYTATIKFFENESIEYKFNEQYPDSLVEIDGIALDDTGRQFWEFRLNGRTSAQIGSNAKGTVLDNAEGVENKIIWFIDSTNVIEE